MLVVMSDEGRLTVPARARKELGLEGETQFQAEVVDGTLILRPATIIPREDAWAYTPDSMARIEKALLDVQEGRLRQMSEEDLDRLAGDSA